MPCAMGDAMAEGLDRADLGALQLWANATQCLVRLIDPVDLRFKHRGPTRQVITPYLMVELPMWMERGCESSIHGAWAVPQCTCTGSHDLRTRAPPASRVSECVLWGY